MLTKYFAAAMERARYEILQDGSYYGEIPRLQGVYSNAETLEECRRGYSSEMGTSNTRN